jgi:hypothetical protein
MLSKELLSILWYPYRGLTQSKNVKNTKIRSHDTIPLHESFKENFFYILAGVPGGRICNFPCTTTREKNDDGGLKGTRS